MPDLPLQVTQLNMRNLLFGNYLPGEDGSTNPEVFTEVTSFDVLEKTVANAGKTDKAGDDSAEKGDGEGEEEGVDPAAAADEAIAVLPNRFSLELTSHLSHVLSLSGGHAVVGGRGGVGRRAAARLAAKLAGLTLLEVEGINQLCAYLGTQGVRVMNPPPPASRYHCSNVRTLCSRPPPPPSPQNSRGPCPAMIVCVCE